MEWSGVDGAEWKKGPIPSFEGRYFEFDRPWKWEEQLIYTKFILGHAAALHQGSFIKNEGIPSPRVENPQENARDQLCRETVSYEWIH
jgi:hypothetical protein